MCIVTFHHCWLDTIKIQKTQLARLTKTRSTVGRQLESLVTVAHEGAVGVEAAVHAWFILTLVHIWRNNSGREFNTTLVHRMEVCMCVYLCEREKRNKVSFSFQYFMLEKTELSCFSYESLSSLANECSLRDILHGPHSPAHLLCSEELQPHSETNNNKAIISSTSRQEH